MHVCVHVHARKREHIRFDCTRLAALTHLHHQLLHVLLNLRTVLGRAHLWTRLE